MTSARKDNTVNKTRIRVSLKQNMFFNRISTVEFIKGRRTQSIRNGVKFPFVALIFR